MPRKPKVYKPKRVSTKKYQAKKSTVRAKYYDKDWDRYRFRFLHHNPNCYICNEPANVVDHIRAHKGDRDLFKNTHNHMPLCTAHHNYITGKFDRQDNPLTEEKCKWIQEERKRLNNSKPIKILPDYIKKKR